MISSFASTISIRYHTTCRLFHALTLLFVPTNTVSSSAQRPQAMVRRHEPAVMSEHAFGEACHFWLRRSRRVNLAAMNNMNMRLGGEV